MSIIERADSIEEALLHKINITATHGIQDVGIYQQIEDTDLDNPPKKRAGRPRKLD